jgi:hypothetical protein
MAAMMPIRNPRARSLSLAVARKDLGLALELARYRRSRCAAVEARRPFDTERVFLLGAEAGV